MGEYDFVYVHTDIPEGMTIREWRAERAARAVALRDAERRARRQRATAIRTKVAQCLARLLAPPGIVRTLRGRPLEPRNH